MDYEIGIFAVGVLGIIGTMIIKPFTEGFGKIKSFFTKQILDLAVNEISLRRGCEQFCKDTEFWVSDHIAKDLNMKKVLFPFDFNKSADLIEIHRKIDDLKQQLPYKKNEYRHHKEFEEKLMYIYKMPFYRIARFCKIKGRFKAYRRIVKETQYRRSFKGCGSYPELWKDMSQEIRTLYTKKVHFDNKVKTN